ncbi:MAG: hypothetical protein C0412_18245 [Flavobacterium sp.]|nr:hypothetical protein [Flavobacterium sp.]
MQKKIRGLAIVSTAFLCIDVICLIGLTVIVIQTKGPFLAMYEETEMVLPIVTKIALSLNHYVFIVGALILIAKEWSKRKLITLIINVAAFLIVLFFALLYSLAVFLPLYRLGQIVG